MPNLNAALGLAQLENLPSFLENKRSIYLVYSQAFSSFKEFIIQKEPENSKSNYWLQTLVLEKGFEDQRDLILEATNASGIMTRPSWTLLHKLKPFENSPCMDLSTAESLEKRIINIPSSSNLG
jgi:dTDP-4-amino-4,6-dideoxygalactose transaminase